MIIDSHTHINSKIYDDVKPIIERINIDDNINSVINVAFDTITSQESIKISKDNDKFFSSVGIHPLYINNDDFYNLYYLNMDKVVAIGKIGLDSFNKNIEEQKKFLIKRIFLPINYNYL